MVIHHQMNIMETVAEMWAYIKGQLELNMSNYINNESAVLQLSCHDVLTSQ
ncbi:hypothetical protein EDO6_03881 [Paenibacillus xylanexedens]|nr:hypothetical protein EDO6_03881 [Paenibacillus xylanexedens]